MNVNIRKLTPDAVIPTYATAGAAGFDLYAAADAIIAPGETVKVPLGLAFEIPVGYEMQLRPRSGVTLKSKLRVQLGTIDADYRGEVSVIVDNISEYVEEMARAITTVENTVEWEVDAYYDVGTYIIRKGDRIAQGVIAPVTRVSFTEANEELTQTERGSGGFGSTGIGTEVDA